MPRPPQPAQCGRTYPHLPHETDAGDGWCYGLDGTEVMRGETCTTPACTRDHPTEVRALLPSETCACPNAEVDRGRCVLCGKPFPVGGAV